MSDATGIIQFLKAMGEIARGARAPFVHPIWQRKLLNVRDSPQPTCTHHEYDEEIDTKGPIILDDMAHRSFFFGPTKLAALPKFVPPHLRTCSTFDLLTTSIWRCRTIALNPTPDEELRDARAKFDPPLPVGYYGNAFVFRAARSTVGKLCHNPLGYALELVMKAKSSVMEEYVRSVADVMVIKGLPHFKVPRSYVVANIARAEFREVDFGWGKSAYGGLAKGEVGVVPGLTNFYLPSKNNRGERGIVVPMCLTTAAMEKFVVEIDNNQLVMGKISIPSMSKL